MANVGKLFEEDFKDSFNKYKEEGKFSVDRFHDGVGGYAVKNICDFISYVYPNQFYFELKSYQGERISFDAISKKQFDGLLEKSKIGGVRAGVIFNFNQHDESYFIPIQSINAMKSSNHKSISLDEARLYGALMPVKKKRKVTIDYDIEQFIINIGGLY